MAAAATASAIAIGATVVVSFLEVRLGIIIAVGLVLLAVWVIQRIERHAWKKL